MRSNLPVSLLFAISFQCFPASALPFLRWGRASPSPLLATRASVSVVPIDGSGGDGESGSGGATATTILQTVSKTVVETLPPVTETDTVVVTVKPTTESDDNLGVNYTYHNQPNHFIFTYVDIHNYDHQSNNCILSIYHYYHSSDLNIGHIIYTEHIVHTEHFYIEHVVYTADCHIGNLHRLCRPYFDHDLSFDSELLFDYADNC
ncbi:hypothetical protein TruAng_012102 [Truncatella angustata]|nr:hypothetical protein TruAng_012102 [Truncatella angustata]